MKTIAGFLLGMIFWGFVSGCNKESYIESIGFVMFESSEDTDVGYFIFTSSGGAGACGQLTVFIDGVQVGVITSDYSGNITPKTEPVEGKIIKVVATAGTHSIVVKYGNGCRNDAKTSYTLEKGKTMWYYIS